jgi:molybdenum cofactor biosynthesis enzyme
VDVGDRDVTVRNAKASGMIFVGVEAFEVVKQGTCENGDVLSTAKVAAANAVKSTGTRFLCVTLF